VIKLVEVTDQILLLEGELRLLIAAILLAELLVEAVPLLVVVLAVILVLLHGILLLLGSVHTQGLLESESVNLFQDCLEGNQRFLENLMPVFVSEFGDHGHKHGESLVPVLFQDVEEVVILEEAHGAISDLQVNTADAFDNTLEESGDQVLNLVDLANLKYLLQLCQEESFLDTVGEGPVPQKAFQESNCEASIFGEEQHGAPEQLLIE